MKIVLATYGSRGDVQPALALALALKSAGHEVLMTGPPEQGEWIESFGCPFRVLGSNLEDWLRNHPIVQSLKGTIEFTGFLRQECRIQFMQLPAIMEGADLVLAFSVVGGAPTIAESLGARYRYVALFPSILPSSQYPSLFLKNYNLPPWINRASWWFTRKFFNFVFKAIINRNRRQLELTPIVDTWNHLLGERVIVASDSVLGSVPPDVERDNEQVGYFHLGPVGELGADLKAFLSSGSPPVYVGFGSMPELQKETTRMVFEATRDAGQRLILSRGWAHLGDGETEKNCYVVDNVPHPLLFPSVATVVHHGGAGTTATAARAGVPQIIVPHLADQYYWGKQIERLGLGPKPISRSRLTARRLATAIRECLSNEMYQQRAKEVGRILQAQNSIGKAVTIIESEFLATTTSGLKNIYS